jgi:NAD(P)-dependent dehydrogenase (short-subunit alcohol dehydrogenase family)
MSQMTKSKQPKRLIAIVTGGASGIGLAIAKEFIRNNIYTIVVGRDESKLKAAQKSFGKKGTTIRFDVAELKQIPALIKDIYKQYGQVDILVNNAGINLKKNFTEVTDEEFQTILNTNLNAVFSISREVVRIMEKQGGGSIINISSMAAHYGLPRVIAYTASKSAIEGMTMAMAVELSPKGIRVNAIAPGFIITDMTAKALNSDAERKQKVLNRTPMGYMGTPEDVALAALFLATASSKYITGTSIRVDGGNAIGF